MLDKTKSPDLYRSVEAAKELRRQITLMVLGYEPTAGDDEIPPEDLQTINDTLEGELSLDAVIEHALELNEMDEAEVVGKKAIVERYTDAIRKAQKRIESRRPLLQQALEIAGRPEVKTVRGTVRLRPATASLQVIDESEIPTQFFVRPDPALDKKGLTDVLRERHKLLKKAAEIKDDEKRVQEIDRINREHPEIPGCAFVAEGTTLVITPAK